MSTSINFPTKSSSYSSASSGTSAYHPHVLPSPTPVPAHRSPSMAMTNESVVGGPVAPKYLREKLATAFLVIYSVCGFLFMLMALVALGTLIFTNQNNANALYIAYTVTGIVCLLTSAIFAILICSSPAYCYERPHQQSTFVLLISSVLLILTSAGLFVAGAAGGHRIAEFPAAFIGLLYGGIGVQFFMECTTADEKRKQSSYLVPFKTIKF